MSLANARNAPAADPRGAPGCPAALPQTLKSPPPAPPLADCSAKVAWLCPLPLTPSPGGEGGCFRGNRLVRKQEKRTEYGRFAPLPLGEGVRGRGLPENPCRRPFLAFSGFRWESSDEGEVKERRKAETCPRLSFPLFRGGSAGANAEAMGGVHPPARRLPAPEQEKEIFPNKIIFATLPNRVFQRFCGVGRFEGLRGAKKRCG